MNNPLAPAPCSTVTTMRDVASEPTLTDAAIRFANLGIPVFPCVPGGKQPLTPNGFHDATSVARTVRRWWERTPEANIGLPTGTRSGVLVVDVDVHAGGSGFAAFDRARSQGLADTWGWLVRTPSGGIHAYYPAAPSQEQRSWQVPGAHVDFRGDGGYVVAPPSRLVVDGVARAYDVIAVTTGHPAPVDANKLRQFLEPPRPRPAEPSPRVSASGCHPEALARTVELTGEGGRNRALFWASCRMAENGQSRADAIRYLLPAALYAGLRDREIESTIDSAYRAASRPVLGSRRGPTQRSEAIQR